jgi:hypothetical protein
MGSRLTRSDAGPRVPARSPRTAPSWPEAGVNDHGTRLEGTPTAPFCGALGRPGATSSKISMPATTAWRSHPRLATRPLVSSGGEGSPMRTAGREPSSYRCIRMRASSSIRGSTEASRRSRRGVSASPISRIGSLRVRMPWISPTITTYLSGGCRTSPAGGLSVSGEARSSGLRFRSRPRTDCAS